MEDLIRRLLMLTAVCAGVSVWMNERDDARADRLLLTACAALMIAIGLMGV